MQDTEEGEINELSEPERDDAALASYVSSHSLDASQSGNLSMKIMYASEYDFDDDSDDNYDGDDDDDDFEDWSIIHKRLDEAYSETKTTLATERMTVIDDYTTESDTDISVLPAVSVKNVKVKMCTFVSFIVVYCKYKFSFTFFLWFLFCILLLVKFTIVICFRICFILSFKKIVLLFIFIHFVFYFLLVFTLF